MDYIKKIINIINDLKIIFFININMNKSNKIIETMPIGYYIVGFSRDNIYYEIPILASVKYFNNKNENDEVISTNYITLNSYGYNNCYKTCSNYSYIKHPDNVIYKINRINDDINKGISVDEFKKKFMKNVIFKKLDEEINDVIEGAPGSGDEMCDDDGSNEIYDEMCDEMCDEICDDIGSDEINKFLDEKINDVIEGAPPSGDEMSDDYSSDFESDISSSDRELLDYYY